MANRVKFEFLRNLKKTEVELLNIVQTHCPSLTPTDCYIGRNFGLVTFCNPECVNQLFTANMKEKFQSDNLNPKPPSTYYSERTIYAGNIRPFIANSDGKTLIADFNQSNKNMTAVSIFVIPTYNEYRFKLKIVLENKDQAERALIEGIRIKGMLIEQQYIQKEKSINIDQCFKCFSFRHLTNKCDSEKQICSICAGEHHFQSCQHKGKSEKVQCINCNGQHIAVAKSCPVRKEKLKEIMASNNTANKPQPTIVQTTNLNQLLPENFPSLPTTSKSMSNTILNSHNNNNDDNNNNNPTHTRTNTTAWTLPLPTTLKTTTTPETNLPNLPQTQQQTTSLEEDYKAHEWEIRYDVAKTFAEMTAKGDGNALVYLDLMNRFLKECGCSSVTFPQASPVNSNSQTKKSSTSSSPGLPTLTPASPLSFMTGTETNKMSSPPSPNQNLIANTSTPNPHNVTVIHRTMEQNNLPAIHLNSSEQCSENSLNSTIPNTTDSPTNISRDISQHSNSDNSETTEILTLANTINTSEIIVTDYSHNTATIAIPSPSTQDTLNLRLAPSDENEDSNISYISSECTTDNESNIPPNQQGVKKKRKKKQVGSSGKPAQHPYNIRSQSES